MDQGLVRIECPSCEGRGCDECDEGEITIEGCPQQYVSDISEAMNMSSMCRDQKAWPVAGGLLDQSGWFLNFHTELRYEQNQIDAGG